MGVNICVRVYIHTCTYKNISVAVTVKLNDKDSHENTKSLKIELHLLYKW